MALVNSLSEEAPVYEFSYSTGTGTYLLAGAQSTHLPFSARYPAGAVGLTYYVKDGSSGNGSQFEIATGDYDAGAKTLTRPTIIASSEDPAGGVPVNWSGRTRLLIRPLVQPAASCSIVRVTSGTTGPTLILTTDTTVVIWSSAAAGAKSQPLPDPSTEDCKIVHVKMRPSVVDTLTIAPVAGTIEGQGSIDIQQPVDVMLIADGTAGNWDLL